MKNCRHLCPFFLLNSCGGRLKEEEESIQDLLQKKKRKTVVEMFRGIGLINGKAEERYRPKCSWHWFSPCPCLLPSMPTRWLEKQVRTFADLISVAHRRSLVLQLMTFVRAWIILYLAFHSFFAIPDKNSAIQIIYIKRAFFRHVSGIAYFQSAWDNCFCSM